MKPVTPRLPSAEVKSEATEAVGQETAVKLEAADDFDDQIVIALRLLAEDAEEGQAPDDSGVAKGQDAVGHDIATQKGKDCGGDSGAAKGQAAGSTDKGKGQGKEKRQRGERRGKWSGWNTVKRFLENHPTSREPLRQFLRDYHKGHDAAGPTPSSGYPELNNSHTRSNTINFYKRQDW